MSPPPRLSVTPALSLSHTGFRRLLRNRFIREEADPHFAAALDGAGHGDARRFDLPRRDPGHFHRLQPVLAEGDVRAAPRLSSAASALLLSVLDLLWHHH